MAMKPCRECGTDISTEAATCPRCGVPHPTTPTPVATESAIHAARFAALSDEELRRIAQETPPTVPSERAALADELRRRSEASRRGIEQPALSAKSASGSMKSSFLGRAGWGCLGCMGLIVVLVIIGEVTGSGAGSVESEDSPVMAYTMCKQFVEKRLRAPKTADFPFESYRDVTTSLGLGKYRVRSYVDAQNGFGALIRSDYLCEVSTQDGGKTWHPDNIVIQSR